MPDQGTAKWNGLIVEEYAKMSRSKGVQPDTGEIVFARGATQPSNANGILAFFYGGVQVDEFRDCRISLVEDATTAWKQWRYTVRDRRWKWKYPRIDGRYNVRDDDNSVVPGTAKNARELATLLLQALGETGFDVSALPTDANLAPSVDWDFTPAAQQLQELVALFGCDVHLLPNNTVSILREGTGTLPPSTGLQMDAEVGLTITDAPDKVGAYAGNTQFESWLELEPVMYEYPTGQVVLLEDSALKPAGGWGVCDLEACLAVATTEVDTKLQQRKRQQARDYLYRLWRPRKFAGTATKPPGYTGASVTDMRLILPLIPTRLIPGENTPAGEKVMAPPELIGEFFDDTYQRNRNAVNLRKLEPNEFSIDGARGHIRTSMPMYRIQNGGSHLPARLWLRCGYHLRQNLYGSRWTQYWEQATGATNGTATEWLNRSDVNRKIIAVYPTDYAEPFTPGTPIDNLTAINTILQNATTERIYQYANSLTPTVFRYTTILSVPTNGRTSQVTHECGRGRKAQTVASVDFEHDRSQPLAWQKRQLQADQNQAAINAGNFQQVLKLQEGMKW